MKTIGVTMSSKHERASRRWRKVVGLVVVACIFAIGFTSWYYDTHYVKTCSREAEAAFPVQYCDSFDQSLDSPCTIRDTVDVVMTVYGRGESLKSQLRDVAAQTKRASHVWIVQNENHVDTEKIVKEWREESGSSLPVELVHFQGNSRYHGRFHVAYFMSNAEYVSIWDDDVKIGQSWLEHCIDLSRQNCDALVGANGRTFEYIHDSEHDYAVQYQRTGLNDFVGHTWTLKREHLRAYFAEPPVTYITGEDVQLAYALQKIGIKTMKAPSYYFGGANANDIPGLFKNKFASYKKRRLQEVRQWLFCKLMEKGFRPLECKNCDRRSVESCVEQLEVRARAAMASSSEPVPSHTTRRSASPVVAAIATLLSYLLATRLV